MPAPVAHKMEMLQLNGAPLQMLRGGSGPPLLYLHSAGGEVAWLPFHELLARDFDVLAPAHPGFAGSEGLDHIDDMEDLAFHYLDLLDHLGLGRANIVGLSLGGWLAAELATRNPERVERLVLVDACGIHLPDYDDPFEFFQDAMSNPDYPREMRRRCFHDPESTVARGFIPDVIPFNQLLFHYRARQATARVAWNPYFHNPKLNGRLRRIRCPALVVWGDSDGLLSLGFGRAYHEGIAGSKLKIIEKCGHLPPIERPEEFAEIVREFLKE